MLSIIIPTYNRAHLISETLESIQAQTYQDWECLVVDDFSTDNTEELIHQYSFRDNRIKYLKNERKKGAQGARNTGVLKSKGVYVSFFDSDDTMFPERLEKQIRYLQENVSIDICTCYSHLINDRNEITGSFTWITKGNILKQLLERTTYVDYNSAVIRKNIFDSAGLLDEDCPSYQEWDTYISIALYANFGTVHELLINYHQRNSGRISNDNQRELNGLIYIYSKHKELFIENLGITSFKNKLKNLAYLILNQNKDFQDKAISTIPELKGIIFRLKIKNKLSKLLK